MMCVRDYVGEGWLFSLMLFHWLCMLNSTTFNVPMVLGKRDIAVFNIIHLVDHLSMLYIYIYIVNAV